MHPYLVTFSDRSQEVVDGFDSFHARHRATHLHQKSPVSADLCTLEIWRSRGDLARV